MAAALIVNSAFASASLQKAPHVRLDARQQSDAREVAIEFGPLNGHACVTVGKTVVKVSVSGEIVPPANDRPNEGRFFFNVETAPMANPIVNEIGKPLAYNVSLSNFAERVLRGSKAIDVESLCILGGKSVWSIRVDIQVLCDDGGLYDACSLAAICGIVNFKREVVSIDGNSAVQFSTSERDPVPLSLYHIPISTSFGVFETENGTAWIADPSFVEEQIPGVSVLSITVTQHGELCGIHKPGGIPIDFEILHQCIDFSIIRAKRVSNLVSCEVQKRR